MKLIKIIFILFLLTSFGVKAGNPGWTVNPYSFQYSMTVTGVLIIDHFESMDTADVVGAFVGTECRGVTKPIYISSMGRYFAFLMIYSNTASGENVSFKLYNSSDNAIVTATQIIPFAPNNAIGLITSPYVWSNTVLSTNSKILTYSVPQQVSPALIDTTAHTIQLTVPQGTNLNALVASFTVSTYATPRVNNTIQQSGATANNFTSSVVYAVAAENPAYTTNWTVTVSYCGIATQSTVGATQNYCASLMSGGLGGNTPIVGAGAWSIVSGGSGTFSSATSPNSTFTANAYGTYVLRWTISVAFCSSSTADVTVNFYHTPTTATVGSSQNLCGTLLSSGLGGNTPSFGTGSWSIVGGRSGTFSASGTGNSTFTADTTSPYTLRWTISNGNCVSSYADVTLTPYQTIVANGGNDQSVCNTNYTFLNGNTPSSGSCLWTFISGPNTPVLYPVPGPTAIAAGFISSATPYVFRYSITNGPCPANVDLVSVTVVPPVIAIAGADQTICVGSSATLSASASGYSTLLWSSTGTGNFSSISSLNPVYIPSADDYLNGSVLLTLTASQGDICSPNYDQLSLSFHSALSTPAIGLTNQPTCSITTGDVVLTDLPASGSWTLTRTPDGVISSGTGSSVTVSGLFPGTYSYTVTNVSGCYSSTSADVVINPQPTPPSAPTGNVAQTIFNTATVSNLDASGTALKWYDSPISCNLLSAGDTLIDGNTYFASQSLAGCESSVRLAVTVSLTYTKAIQLHLLLEGLFNPTTRTMREAKNGSTGLNVWAAGIADKIDVELYNEDFPYASIGVGVNGIDLTTQGFASFQIPSFHNGNYYIRVSNHNHLAVWTAIAIPFNTNVVSYDFTTDAYQVYGSNPQIQLAVSPDLFAFFVGDLDHSGWVDTDDFNLFEHDLILGSTGVFDADLNGGGWVDADDFNMFEPRLTIGHITEYPMY